MNKQPRTTDTDKLLASLKKEVEFCIKEKFNEKNTRFYLGRETALTDLIKQIKSGKFNVDPIPLPTIKPHEAHACPKCGNKNCFTIPIAELNVPWFMCSFCSKPSPKKEWLELIPNE